MQVVRHLVGRPYVRYFGSRGTRTLGRICRLGKFGEAVAFADFRSDWQTLGPIRQGCDEALEFLETAKIRRNLAYKFVVDVENNMIAGRFKPQHRRGE